MKGHDVFFKVIKGHARGVKVCDPIYSHRLLETLIQKCTDLKQPDIC